MSTLITFHCPHCGGHVTQPTAPKAVKPAVFVDIDAMSDAELFAYRKRTAPVADLAFFLRPTSAVSEPLRARAEAIVKPTAKDIRALNTAWRIERHDAERASDVPAIGSPRWAESFAPAAEAIAS